MVLPLAGLNFSLSLKWSGTKDILTPLCLLLCYTASCEEGKNLCKINGVYVCIFDADKDCYPDNKVSISSIMYLLNTATYGHDQALQRLIWLQDNCKYVYQKNQDDMDGDGVGDVCDNCAHYSNPDQLNTDGDKTGDACDIDDDNDGQSK